MSGLYLILLNINSSEKHKAKNRISSHKILLDLKFILKFYDDNLKLRCNHNFHPLAYFPSC